MDILFILVSIFLAIPTLVFVIQVFLALKMVEPLIEKIQRHSRVAVLIPAHNEALVITNTLKLIVEQLRKEDVLLVVADNCSDRTADLARECGAKVIERKDKKQRGKGFALNFGLQFLEDNNPPGIVIVIDADCEVSIDCIDRLAQQAETLQRPVQALDLMVAPENKTLTQVIAEFAWLVKNQVRPSALMRYGLPCQLMGTGMAFPWKLLRQADLAHGNMVEDMKLGLDLAIQGFSPVFCPDARVTSTFPVSSQVTNEQRTRWEHGHLSTILAEVPRLLKAALKRRDISLLFMALDLSVPPLSLLGLCLLVMLSLSILGMFFTDYTTLLLEMVSLNGLFAIAVFQTWYRFGQEIITFKALCGAPFYILRKIPLYVAFLVKRQKDWVKTERR